MTYQEQLKDPRWQKKRLEIMERDEWTCQMCRDTKATLTVHHKSYKHDGKKFADVWDYNGSDLITLCDDCHNNEEKELESLKNSLYFKLRQSCDNADAIKGFVYIADRIMNKTTKRVRMDDIVIIDSIIDDKFYVRVDSHDLDNGESISEIFERLMGGDCNG